MIVPLSLVATERMRPLRELVLRGASWLASFDMRPSSLFEGIAQRLTILVLRTGSKTNIHTGGYRRWVGEARDSLFAITSYAKLCNNLEKNLIFKAGSEQDIRILKKIGNIPLDLHRDNSSQTIYVHRISRYFIKTFNFVPYFRNSSGEIGRSDDYKPFLFSSQQTPLIVAYLNTSTFYWFWRGISDGFHCGYRDVFHTPYKALDDINIQEQAAALTEQLFASLKLHSQIKPIRTTRGIIEYQEFYPSKSKGIADKIDVLIGESWGFDADEVDYLINYDIKYRMSGADDEE
jgi:hypothetical protein